MDKAEYIKISRDQSADQLPVIYFFAQLRGLKGVPNIQAFGAAFHTWVTTILMRHPADLVKIRQIHEYVNHELDKHFNVEVGI